MSLEMIGINTLTNFRNYPNIRFPGLVEYWWLLNNLGLRGTDLPQSKRINIYLYSQESLPMALHPWVQPTVDCVVWLHLFNEKKIKLTYKQTCGLKPGHSRVQFSSVQLLSRVWLFATPWTTARQASLFLTNFQVYSNSCPLSWWCHPAISSSVVPFSSCPQSLPASGSFQMSQLFACGSQSIGVSASASVHPMNTEDWSPLGWTG